MKSELLKKMILVNKYQKQINDILSISDAYDVDPSDAYDALTHFVDTELGTWDEGIKLLTDSSVVPSLETDLFAELKNEKVVSSLSSLDEESERHFITGEFLINKSFRR
jgi:hypothetical protein